MNCRMQGLDPPAQNFGKAGDVFNGRDRQTGVGQLARRAAASDQLHPPGMQPLGKLDQAGAHIVECPAVLEVRMLGRSKMKTLRTIGGHLRLLGSFVAEKK